MQQRINIGSICSRVGIVQVKDFTRLIDDMEELNEQSL